MSDGDALHRAILMRPAEDTPRLAYADWLQENEQSVPCEVCVRTGCECPHWVSNEYAKRAEFIRVQVGMARLGHNPFECRKEPCDKCPARFDLWEPLHARANSLFQSHGMKWFDVSLVGHIERGFANAMTCNLKHFMEHAEAMFAAHPIERVTLTDREPQSTRHRAGGSSRRWTWFSVGAWATPRGGASELPSELLAGFSPFVGGLRRHNSQTREAAYEWLSARCVAYGRSLAGL